MKRRVAITGISAISSVGIGADANWRSLIEGRSGIDLIKSFDASGLRCQFAGEVKGFNPDEHLDPKDVRVMDPFAQYALVAAKEALVQSGLVSGFERVDEAKADRIASIIGCGLGGLPELERTKELQMQKGASRISPFFIPKMISNLAAGHIAMKFGLCGPSFVTTSACSSGAHAIGESFRQIRDGYIDAAVTGGVESTITELCIGGFAAMRALSSRNDDPQAASRPFDKDRDGFVVGEGCGILVLEEWESAQKRGADIIGEMVGYGTSCDAYHMTAPTEDGSGPAKAIEWALQDAQISKEQVLAINAHATSTGLGDIAETKAIKKAFGEHTKNILVTSTKSMVGHLLGGAGGVEAVYSVQSLKNQIVLPTINLENQDPDCDLRVAANKAHDWKHEYAISNSFGFGGTNVTLVFRRV